MPGRLLRLILRALEGLFVLLLILAVLGLFVAGPEEGKQAGREETAKTAGPSYPANSTRGFTLYSLLDKPVYFELVKIEPITSLDEMLLWPNETARMFPRGIDRPFLALTKFVIRTNELFYIGTSDAICIESIYIERYVKEKKAWEQALTIVDRLSKSEHSGGHNIVVDVLEGNVYTLYYGGYYNLEDRNFLWFEGIDSGLRLHVVLNIPTPRRHRRPLTGDVLYRNESLVVVYERGQHSDYLHVYFEPVKLPYSRLKLEDAKVLNASRSGYVYLEVKLRNVGSLPLLLKLSREGDLYFRSRFPLTVLTVNGKYASKSLWGFCAEAVVESLPHRIDLPKPWEKKDWVVVVLPGEEFRARLWVDVDCSNTIAVESQGSAITLRARPVVRRVVNVTASLLLGDLSVQEITLELENRGDAPLFLARKSLAEFLKVWVAGKEAQMGYMEGVVLPGEVRNVTIDLESIKVSKELLAKGFTVRVAVTNGSEVTYEVPPLKPEVKVVSVKYWEWFGEAEVDEVVLSVFNNWVFPIDPEWIEVYANGKKVSYTMSPYIWKIKVGESVKISLDLTWGVKKGSLIEVRLGATVVRIRA